MCATCGCGADDVRVTVVGADHHHPHGHGHGGHGPEHHGPDRPGPAHRPSRTLQIEQDVLAKNAGLAAGNRAWLAERGAVAVNLMSSPGAGKTTLLERTVRALASNRPVCVVEGDQETLLDARRIRSTGCPVVQINTGAGCHLDADMLRRGLVELDPAPGALVLVENVGNLVCPALFDLGEARRVVMTAVTEGADKPLKYPHMFASADLVLVTKTDLLPHLDLDLDELLGGVRQVNPRADVLTVSVTRGDAMNLWYDWLDDLGASRDTPGSAASDRPAPLGGTA